MDAPQYKSIEYQFRDQRLYEDYYALFSIGWEYWASPEVYYRDCRTSAYKQCVFQYTVSGEGTLVYNQKAYAIKPGQAFLIERPGQYQYYRSPNAKHWELKFITLNICLRKPSNSIMNAENILLQRKPAKPKSKLLRKLSEMLQNRPYAFCVK